MVEFLKRIFTPKVWKIINEYDYIGESFTGDPSIIGRVYILQDQFGNIKKTVIKV